MRMLILALTAGAALAPAIAEAGSPCLPHDEVVGRLASKHDEHRTAWMTDMQGNLVEIFANAETSAWTLVVTGPNGRACIVSHGQGYELDTTEPKRGTAI